MVGDGGGSLFSLLRGSKRRSLYISFSMSRLVSNDGKVTEDVVVYVHSSGKKEAKRCDSVDGFVIRSPVFIRTSTTVRECNTQNIRYFM